MTFERSPEPTADAGSTPVHLRLEILASEHASLLAARSLAWNESFARAGMYLSTLSGAMVALGLVAGLDRVGDLFFLFAAVVLPVVLFIGVATWIRMGAANYHEALTVQGMNRIRGAYLEIAPELEPYFVMGIRDDLSGIARTMATPPGQSPMLYLIGATPFVVAVLNAVVAGAIAALVFVRALSATLLPAAVLAVVVAAVVLGAQARAARSNIRRGQPPNPPMFPEP